MDYVFHSSFNVDTDFKDDSSPYTFFRLLFGGELLSKRRLDRARLVLYIHLNILRV